MIIVPLRAAAEPLAASEEQLLLFMLRGAASGSYFDCDGNLASCRILQTAIERITAEFPFVRVAANVVAYLDSLVVGSLGPVMRVTLLRPSMLTGTSPATVAR